MKTWTVSLLPWLLILLSGQVRADYFQVFDGNSAYYVPNAPVYAGGQLLGHTDMYGRIKIDKPPGRYIGEVIDRNRPRRIEFTADGGRTMKRINAQ